MSVSTCLPVYLSVSLPVGLTIYLTALPIYLSVIVHPSIFVYLSICPFTCLSTCLCLPISLIVILVVVAFFFLLICLFVSLFSLSVKPIFWTPEWLMSKQTHDARQVTLRPQCRVRPCRLFIFIVRFRLVMRITELPSLTPDGLLVYVSVSVIYQRWTVVESPHLSYFRTSYVGYLFFVTSSCVVSRFLRRVESRQTPPACYSYCFLIASLKVMDLDVFKRCR